MQILSAPFPRPERSLKNVFRIFLLSLGSTIFILIFKPYNIQNPTGEWYNYLVLSSMGGVFFLSIAAMELFVPSLWPKLFKKWNLLKAIIWYTWVLLFVSFTMFLYKSYLGNFADFNFQEYIFIIGRLLGIAIIVSVFILGLFNQFNRKSFSFLSSDQTYRITAPNDQDLHLNPKDILYIVSDNNYVDIHILSKGEREKITFRSSLKNIEAQLVNSLTPIYRCHRSYLINIAHFKLKRKTSRQTTIRLLGYEEDIPVSSKYVDQVIPLLQIRT